MTNCYARDYWLANPGYHLEDSEFKAAGVVAALENLEMPSRLRICDVGCGAGGVVHHVAEMLNDSGHEVDRAVGYDISPRAISQGTMLFPNLEFHVGGATDVPSGWDLILAMDVIEHLENYHKFLRDLRGKAALYAFHIPMELSALRALHQIEFAEAIEQSGHIHSFCETTALKTIESLGFVTVHRAWTDVDYQQRRKAAERPGWKRMLVNGVRSAIFRVCPSFAVALLGGKSLLLIFRDGD